LATKLGESLIHTSGFLLSPVIFLIKDTQAGRGASVKNWILLIIVQFVASLLEKKNAPLLSLLQCSLVLPSISHLKRSFNSVGICVLLFFSLLMGYNRLQRFPQLG